MTISNDQALIQSCTVSWVLEIVRCEMGYLTWVYDDMQIMFKFISLHTFAHWQHMMITIAKIFEQGIAAWRDDAFKELLPTFWIRPVTWLHAFFSCDSSPHLLVPYSAADEAWYWPKYILCSGWLRITSRPVFFRKMWFIDSSRILDTDNEQMRICMICLQQNLQTKDGPFVPCREVVLFSEVFFLTYWKVLKNK